MVFLRKLMDTGLKVDSFFQTPSIRTLIFSLTIASCFILILALNLLQPIFFDDWAYAFVYRDLDTHERIQSILDIFRSQYHHYYTWGGRSIAHFIAQLLILIGDPWARIINSMAYTLFIYIIYLHAKGNNKGTNVSLFVLINILLWYFQVDYSRSVLWLTGSANYLWCTLIILLFLLPYRLLFDKPNTNDSIIKVVLYFLFGIIAGWTNENMAGAMIFMIICIFIYLYIYKRQIPKWSIFGLVGALIGFLIMVSAPGNFIRYQIIVNSWQAGEISLISQYLGGLSRVISGIFFFLFSIIGLFSLASVIYYFVPNNNNRKSILLLALLYLATAIVAALAMIFSPTFPGRAWFGIITFIIVGISLLIAHIDFTQPFLKYSKYVILSFLVISLLGYYYQTYNDMNRASKVYFEREKFIVEQKKLGIKDFIFNYDVHPTVQMNYLHDLYSSPDNWHNANYSRYYDINSVIILRPTESE